MKSLTSGRLRIRMVIKYYRDMEGKFIKNSVEKGKRGMTNTENHPAEENFTHKVGVKELSDTQLKNILPDFRNIFTKIEQFRKAAAAEENQPNSSRKYYQYNLKYDNVFSILGKRGTGKTSVAFTLRNRIEQDEKHKDYDVVLPLIIPESIPENCTVLGWLLAIVKEEMEALEKNIRDLERTSGGEQNRSRFRYMEGIGSKDSLETKLEDISQMFFAGSYNPSNEKSYYRAIDNSVQQAGDYYRFAKEIANLWDTWIERIRKLYELKHGKAKEKINPMIYFLFDDVDLAPEKISEILSVIIKYLSHPNIIVIITADEKLFLEVVENQLDKKIGRLPGEWREFLSRSTGNGFVVWGQEEITKKKETEDVVNQTAAMYLGKVLPPSTRYYLRLFHTAKQKERFYVEEGKTLGAVMSERIAGLAEAVWKKDDNFMVVNDRLINFYLKFYGSTSRQINNVYVAFNELVARLHEIIENEKSGYGTVEDGIEELYQCCRYFICVALISNQGLAKIVENADSFVDEVFLPEYNQWRLYINYSYLNEYVEDNVEIKTDSEEENRAAKVEAALQMYSLFSFVENILLLMERAFPGGITARGKVHAIPFMIEYIQSVAFDDRYMFREDLPANDFFEHYNNLLDRLSNIVGNGQSKDMQFSLTYFYDFRNSGLGQDVKRQRNANQGMSKMDIKGIARRSPGWFTELVGMVTMVYGNAYLFDRSEMADCMVFRDRRYQVGYQQKIRDTLQEYMNQCFGHIKLQDVWISEKWKENLESTYEELDRTNKRFNELVEKVTSDLMSLVEEKEEENYGERKQQWVSLSLILQTVYQYLNLEECLKQPRKIWELLYQSPIDIAGEIGKGLKEIPSGRGQIRRMLADRIASVDRIEYAWNNKGMLSEPDRTAELFETLFRLNPSKYEELKRIGAEIKKSMIIEQDQRKVVLVEKTLYRRMLTALGQALEKQKLDSSQYIDSEEEMLLFEAREVLLEWEIGVDLYNEEATRRAVKLGVEVVWIGVLQAIYLYQTVNERYRNYNSISSKALEQIDGKNTYYFSFFNIIVNFMEDTEYPWKDISIKEKIESAFIRERQKYVEQLIARVRNE